MPWLCLSSYAPESLIEQEVLDPGSEILGKPFTPGELHRKVRGLLEGVRLNLRVVEPLE